MRLVGGDGSGGDLATDVDLVAQVDAAVRHLVSEARVPAELGRIDVLDLQPVGFREGEEGAGHVVDARREFGIDAMSGHVEEPDGVHHLAQFVDEGLRLGRRLVGGERAEIEQRQRMGSAHPSKIGRPTW